MNTNTEIFEQLNSYFKPNEEAEKEEPLKLTSDSFRRLYEWEKKRVNAYVTIIGGLLGGMNAIVQELEKGEIPSKVLLKIIRDMSTDAHNGFDKVREIDI